MHNSDKRLLKLAKGRAGKKMYSELKKIENKEDMRDATGRLLALTLERDIIEIKNYLLFLEKHGKDVFLTRMKALALESKIHYFRADFSPAEFEKILGSIEKLKKGLTDEKSI